MIKRANRMMRATAIWLSLLAISLCGTAFGAVAPTVTTLAPLKYPGFYTPSRVALDSSGNIFVTDAQAGTIVRFDRYGRLAKVVQLRELPQGFALQSDDRLLVGLDSTVAVLDAEGHELSRFGSFLSPAAIAIDPAGYVYVVDTRANQVKVFTSSGAPVRTFGARGTGAGLFDTPSAIAIDPVNNEIAVVDTMNHRVQLFDFNGTFIRSVGSILSGPLQLVYPNGVSYDAAGRMYISDGTLTHIKVIDPAGTGTFLANIGRYPAGRIPVNGELMNPGDVACDQATNRIFVPSLVGYVTVYGIDGGTSPIAETTPPPLTMNPVPTEVPEATLTVSGTVGAGARFSLTLNGAPVDAYVNGTTWVATLTLVPGANVIAVKATNTVGDSTADAKVNFLTAAPALNVEPVAPFVKDPEIVISGTTEAGAAVTVALNDGSAQNVEVTNGAWSFTVTGLLPGANTIKVSASKPASATAVRSVGTYFDNVSPALTVSALADGSYTSTQVQNVAGTVSDANLAQVMVNGQPAAVADGQFGTSVTLTAGSNIITIIAADLAGNISTDTRILYFDNAIPVISIASPAEGAVTATRTVTFSGTVDKPGRVSVAGLPATVDASGNWTAPVELMEGQNTVVVSTTDLYGMSSEVKRTVVLDSVAPQVAVTDPAQDIATSAPLINVVGSVSEAAATVAATVNGAKVTVAMANGIFNFPVQLAEEKQYSIVVTAVDAAGNAGSVIRTVTVDRTAPALTVDVAAPTATWLTGTSEPGATVSVDVAGVKVPANMTNGSAWRIDLTGLAFELAKLQVTAADAAGNATVKPVQVLQEQKPQPVVYPDGDINGDGKVNMADATMALQIVVKNQKPTAQQMLHGDVAPLVGFKPAPDGKFDMEDVSVLFMKAQGKLAW